MASPIGGASLSKLCFVPTRADRAGGCVAAPFFLNAAEYINFVKQLVYPYIIIYNYTAVPGRYTCTAVLYQGTVPYGAVYGTGTGTRYR